MSLDTVVPTYGQRFKAVRVGRGWVPGKKPRLTQRQVAKALGYELPAPASPLEKKTRLPRLVTVQDHATALGCQPWELLLGVPTDYDHLRWPGLSPQDVEHLLAGLALLAPEQRMAVVRTCAKAVLDYGSLFPAETPSVRKSKPVTEESVGKTFRRKMHP